MVPEHEHRQALPVALAWLYDTEQPDGAILQHHGVTLRLDERRYHVIPRAWAGNAVIATEVTRPRYDMDSGRYTVVLEPDELALVTRLLAELGHEVVSTWNGHPAITGSLALARPARPSLIAAVDRYCAGCPEHPMAGALCSCGWYAAGNRLIVHPTAPTQEALTMAHASGLSVEGGEQHGG